MSTRVATTNKGYVHSLSALMASRETVTVT